MKQRNKETKVEKAKKWVKRHKKELIFSAAIIGSFVLGTVVSECSGKKLKKEKELEYQKSSLSKYDESVKLIDKDIFTSLAPAIEHAVISDGIESYINERTYTIEFDGSGDVRCRKVSVSVEDMGQLCDL